MKRLLIVMLLLMLPSLAWGQAVIVGEFPPAEKIKEARYTLATAEPKVLALNVGEFEIIEPAKSLAGVPLYWHISDSSIMQRIDVAANQTTGLWMKRRGEPEAKLHLFPARPVAWVILVGAKQGASSIAIIRNGLVSTTDPPAVVDSVAVTVVAPKPVDPPQPPPDDPLVKAFRTAITQDVAAGKADKKWLLLLAGVYEMASEDELLNVKTMGALNDLIGAAIDKLKIPKPDLQFPSLRRAIQQEMFAKLGVNKDGGSMSLTNDLKVQARSCMARIAKALEEVAK